MRLLADDTNGVFRWWQRRFRWLGWLFGVKVKTYSGSSGASVMRKTQWRGLRCMDMVRLKRVCDYKAMEFTAAINVPAWWVCGEICIGECVGWWMQGGAWR